MPGKGIAEHVPQFNGQELEQFSVQQKLKDNTCPFPPYHSSYPSRPGKSHQNAGVMC